ncbi:hypothetical protein A6K24_07465 [Metabacillus litoralis]|uniref:Uncharacterized protein n=1 Tax=Metabacillus litoralis TaxID=152268 RepID=A0A179SQB4_9BACI|nr:hypothetical protein A6K24_07465 [Metabacillus litoralis]
MSFHKRREKYKQKRKIKKKDGRFTFTDFLTEALFYFPEIILFPFRLLWYSIRFIIRVFDWT